MCAGAVQLSPSCAPSAQMCISAAQQNVGQQPSAPFFAMPMQGGNYQLLCMMDQNRSTLAPGAYLLPINDGGFYQMAQFPQMPVSSMTVNASCGGVPSHVNENNTTVNCSAPGGYVFAVHVLPQCGDLSPLRPPTISQPTVRHFMQSELAAPAASPSTSEPRLSP